MPKNKKQEAISGGGVDTYVKRVEAGQKLIKILKEEHSGYEALISAQVEMNKLKKTHEERNLWCYVGRS
jgi:hypothetical protein